MGNHDAGRAMVHCATALAEAGVDKTPLQILDIACEPYRGCDAEFDDEKRADTPFGDLLTKAFGQDLPPGTIETILDPAADQETFEAADELWYETVARAFSKRYGLT